MPSKKSRRPKDDRIENAVSTRSRISLTSLNTTADLILELWNALSSHSRYNKHSPSRSPLILHSVMDFLVRSIQDYLLKLNPDKINSGDKLVTEVYSDLLIRNEFISLLITDKTGKAKWYGKSEEQDFEFGEEIEAKAKVILLSRNAKGSLDELEEGEGWEEWLKKQDRG